MGATSDYKRRGRERYVLRIGGPNESVLLHILTIDRDVELQCSNSTGSISCGFVVQ